MRSKNVEDWKPGAFRSVRITDVALRQCIGAANGSLDEEQSERLRKELKQVVMSYLDARHSGEYPSASSVRSKLTAIAKRAKELSEALGDGEAEGGALVSQGLLRAAVAEIPPGHGRVDQARESLDAAIRGVRKLESWAEVMASEADEAVGNKNAHGSDHALDGLLFNLALAYERAFDTEAATSVGGPGSPNAGKAGGPVLSGKIRIGRV